MALQPSNPTKRSEQDIENLSFDESNGLIAVEMVGYDGTNMVRVEVDSTGALMIA